MKGCHCPPLLHGRSRARVPDYGRLWRIQERQVVFFYVFLLLSFKRKVLIDFLRYTCEECVQGLEWVENYIEDPIMIAEYVVYLEQNFCQGAT